MVDTGEYLLGIDSPMAKASRELGIRLKRAQKMVQMLAQMQLLL